MQGLLVFSPNWKYRSRLAGELLIFPIIFIRLRLSEPGKPPLFLNAEPRFFSNRYPHHGPFASKSRGRGDHPAALDEQNTALALTIFYYWNIIKSVGVISLARSKDG